MRRVLSQYAHRGFTLLELMISLGIFLLICGAAFTLLATSQQRSRTDTQVLTSFQEARLGLDQIVRDVNDAGYPPPTYTDGIPADSASSPFGWSPGYTVPTPCQIGTGGGGTCITPTDWDLIIEANPTPLAGPPVQWIRYSLQGTTLLRGSANKGTALDPAVQTFPNLVPFVQNVVNNSAPAQIAQYQLSYPNMFPGGAPVPIFSYICDSPAVPQSPPPPTVPCPIAGADNSPANIRDVIITLIVASPLPDARTGQPRLVQLTGRGRRINPNQ
ncbi:MAG TPA: type II secretion system protein [Candidatus Acidoferrum sp.]|nr:type II secretion system protein [Candidatus Acidoferrum sp.]